MVVEIRFGVAWKYKSVGVVATEGSRAHAVHGFDEFILISTRGRCLLALLVPSGSRIRLLVLTLALIDIRIILYERSFGRSVFNTSA